MPDPSPPLILVVDADEGKRSSIIQALRRAEYAVTEARTGAEAIQLAANGPALVVLDLELPDATGFEICRRLKADPATSIVPILQISTTFADSDPSGHEGAADAYLTDVAEPAVLLAAVRSLLRMRKAEDAAQAAARAWQATFDAISDGVFLLDKTGRLIRCNYALAAVIGRPAAELLGRPVAALHPRLHAAAVPFAECLATRRRATSEVVVDGHQFRLTADPVLTVGGDLAGAVGILSDVTDLHQAQAARRSTEEMFRTLVESVRDYAIFRIDPDGRVTTWNEGVRRVLGFAEAEFIGTEAQRLFTPEDAAAGIPEREMRQAAADGSANNDRWMTKKDGTRFFASGTTSAVRDEVGTLIGFTKVMRDVTDRRRVEEALHAADKRKDEFLAMLGHELRNPLAPIRNALFLMKLRKPNDPGDVERLRIMMDRQLTHIARLVDDLLDVSRITQGKIELRTEAVDMRDAIANAVDEVRPLLVEREHTLHLDLPPDTMIVQADPIRLEQVFANLLHNAAKYTEPGGKITVTAVVRETPAGPGAETESRTADEATVVLHSAAHTPPTHVVEVRVRDTGIGIRPELVDRIFDMFTQGDRVSGRLKEGLGLGLTLVKSLVEMHGGTVGVTSPGHGKGSEFIVRLPAAPTEDAGPRADESGGSGQPPVRRSMRVLVVDDNVDAAESLRMVLEMQAGHTVRVAYDGATGLAAARDFQPDAILLDIGLPKGMDGYEVARRLRTIPGQEQTPIVALTGYGRTEDRERSGAAGFTAHLVKPVDPEELRELLSQLAED
jgi:PAS domain S-box-containing protein